MDKSGDVNALVGNTAWVYGGKIISQIIGVVASVLVIKKLPVDVFGTYSLVLSIYTVLRLVLISPLRDVIMRFYPELKAKEDFVSLSILAKKILLTVVCCTAIFIFLVYFLQGMVSQWFNIVDFNTYFTSFVIYASVFSIKLVIEAMFNALLFQKYTSLFNVAVIFLRAVLYILLLDRLSIVILLQVEAAVMLVFVLLSIGFYLRNNSKVNLTSNGTQKELNKRVVRFGSLSAMNELGAGVIGSTFDFFIISAYANTFAVGLYGFALKVIELFYRIIPIREFQSVLNPIFIKNFSSNDVAKEKLDDFYNIMVKFIVPIFIVPFVFFVVFGKGVIEIIYDPKYIDSYLVICIILFGSLLDTVFIPLAMIIKLKEKVEINLYSKVMIVFSIIAGIYGIKYFGVVGVAIASILGSLFKNIFMLILSRRHFKIRFDFIVFVNYSIVTIITILPFIFFQTYFSDLLYFIIGILVFTPYCLVVILLFLPFTDNERELLKSYTNHSKKLSMVYKVIDFANNTKCCMKKAVLRPFNNFL